MAQWREQGFREKKMAGVKQGRDGAVGILTLNEPESLNAMTP
jgi:enoyl-CoA hydratase/carnithine racemase